MSIFNVEHTINTDIKQALIGKQSEVYQYISQHLRLGGEVYLDLCNNILSVYAHNSLIIDDLRFFAEHAPWMHGLNCCAPYFHIQDPISDSMIGNPNGWHEIIGKIISIDNLNIVDGFVLNSPDIVFKNVKYISNLKFTSSITNITFCDYFSKIDHCEATAHPVNISFQTSKYGELVQYPPKIKAMFKDVEKYISQIQHVCNENFFPYASKYNVADLFNLGKLRVSKIDAPWCSMAPGINFSVCFLRDPGIDGYLHPKSVTSDGWRMTVVMDISSLYIPRYECL